MDPEHLLDLLAYKRQMLGQFLTVASIFGGFAVTGVIALRTDTRRDRIHAIAFGAMALAAIAFIFATALVAIWLPVSQLKQLQSPSAIQTVLDTGESVVWAILIGAINLVVAVGLMGFARSRRMGVFVLIVAIVVAAAFIFNICALIRAA